MSRFAFSTPVIGIACALMVVACGDNLSMPVTPEAYHSVDQQPLECVPNLDGRIDSGELQEAIGVPVSYLLSPANTERVVDLVGSIGADGRRVWDWSTGAEVDQLARIQASSVSGRWYDPYFPSTAFVTPFDGGGAIEGVYEHDDDGLWLLGLASSEVSPAEGATLLVYSDPVALYRFPIEVGASWTSVGEVRNGTLRDLPYAGRDTYVVEVVRSGLLGLPDLTFTQALQVQTHVTVEPAVGFTTTQRQTSFLFECFGEVARATSEPDEPNADFTTAIEVRRLSLLGASR